MDPQDQNNVADFPAPGQELYLPFGATDPDFYIPADCDRAGRGILPLAARAPAVRPLTPEGCA